MLEIINYIVVEGNGNTIVGFALESNGVAHYMPPGAGTLLSVTFNNSTLRSLQLSLGDGDVVGVNGNIFNIIN